MFGPPPEEPDDPEEALPEQYREPSVEEFEPSSDLEGKFGDLEGKFEDADVSRELARDFWSLVVTVNVGLFVAALGLMVAGFRGEWQRGGAAFALGAGLLVYAYYRYRRVRRDRQG